MNSLRRGVAFSLKSFPRIVCSNQIATSQVPVEDKLPRSSGSDNSTHFGFDKVSPDEKGRKVYEVFHKVADSYDLMNDAMSVGIHRLWKDIFVDRLGPTPGTELLDVAGGTGDIAFRFLNYVVDDKHNSSKVTVCDINEDMLRVGRERSKIFGVPETKIDWVQGNAETLPFPDNTFSAYTIAFGIRNVTHIDKALDEAYRVLKPGGRFLCLEFSRVNNEVIRKLYDLYSFQVIPVLGQVLAGDWKSYQYLVESIRQFPTQEQFKDMIQNAGFWNVHYENLTFGVVAIHSGFKL